MTLKDIAREAGVSMMTVSNGVNGRHNKVSDVTIQKINEIIEQNNYIPNLSARSLTVKSSGIVAIIISTLDNEHDDYSINPFVNSMIGAIERHLRENGYYTMVRAISKYDEVNNLLRNWNLNGIIFLTPVYEKEIEKQIENINCPLLIFDSGIDSEKIINVTSDDRGGLYLATKYLINHGHKNIAFVADYKENPLLTRRFHGYIDALKENNIEVNEDYIFEYPPIYDGGILAGKHISSNFKEITAVVTTADICAIGIMEGARLNGLRIPADLSVLGFDDLELCSYTTPKLTSISQHIEKNS